MGVGGEKRVQQPHALYPSHVHRVPDRAALPPPCTPRTSAPPARPRKS